MRRGSGVTLLEMLTVLVAVVVLTAVAIPLWRTHGLRVQRQQAMDLLRDIQVAQDRHFGQHARYAGPESIDLPRDSTNYRIDVKRSDDALGYVATAHAIRSADGNFDSRCAELSIDQHGRRFARDETGRDSTGDCWYRK